MKRATFISLAVTLLLGCGGVTATPSAAPTSVPPTATLPAGPTPGPTYTPADQRVDDMIRDGFAQLSGYSEDLQRAPDAYAMAPIFRDMGSLAGSQQLIAQSLDPSVCTSHALDLWVESMVLAERSADAWLDEWDSGGDFSDFTTEDAYNSGLKAGQAVKALNESVCV